MDKIEKSINHFFQRLGHTPGPWKLEDEFVRASSLDGQDHGNVVADIYTRPSYIYEDEQNFNATLVAQSPDMLRTLCRTYLHLLTHPQSHSLRVYADSVLAIQISEATGIEGAQVQEAFEQYATWIQLGGDIPPKTERQELADQRDPETKVFSAMQEGSEDWDDRP